MGLWESTSPKALLQEHAEFALGIVVMPDRPPSCCRLPALRAGLASSSSVGGGGDCLIWGTLQGGCEALTGMGQCQTDPARANPRPKQEREEGRRRSSETPLDLDLFRVKSRICPSLLFYHLLCRSLLICKMGLCLVPIPQGLCED